MKTKGALIWEFNQPWSIEEIEIGDPVKDEVKIQMEASGMCHSDHHLVTGKPPIGMLAGDQVKVGVAHPRRFHLDLHLVLDGVADLDLLD